MRNLCSKRQQTHRCRNLRLTHWKRLLRMILASSSSCRYLSMTLESGNTNAKCRRSVRQYCTSTDTPMPQSSIESSEHVVESDLRKQLEPSLHRYELAEWKYEFQVSLFTSTILNLLFTEAEQKGKTRNFRMYGSSADNLSLDLKFNPWDTAITFKPEWRSMSKTVFTQYDPFENLVQM